MSSTTTAGASPVGIERDRPRISARAYFWSDGRRIAQTILGVLWLLDGALQFQSFMYSKGFIQMLTGMTAGQPGWLTDSMNWAAGQAQLHLAVGNTAFALIQVFIGLGLLYRPTVKVALAASLVWALVVWWFGEAFGMLLMGMAMPLTGAPGAVSLYALIGLAVWPTDRPGGLLGVRGTRIAWAAVWALMAVLWLEAPSSNANAIAKAIQAAPSGMSWLSTVQNWGVQATTGNGLVFALILAAASLAIAVAVAANRAARPFLVLAIVLSVAYWVFGQGFGGIFAGGATDPNAGPLFVLFAYVMWTLTPYESAAAERSSDRTGGRSPLTDPTAA